MRNPNVSRSHRRAFVADITGQFRLLFIQKPYRGLFRIVRWLIASLAMIGTLAVIE